MRRTSITAGIVLSSVFLSLSATADTIATPNPVSQKYRDTGAKPATGRSGSAAIQARALLGAGGTTDLEVTTGTFDGGTPLGSLAKIQIKLLTDGGDVLQTDNFRKTLTGNGYADFIYDNLTRGQLTQVQASVTGIDPNRTDVVTVSTNVKLRPDLEAGGINAPAQVMVDTPVTVSGVVAEINGDVGARSTCRLLVDDVEVGAIPGIWTDASSSVTCQFHTSFGTTGTKRIAFRVSDVVPGDYDASNNQANASIEVVNTQDFAYMQAQAYDYQYRYAYSDRRTFTRYDGAVSTYSRDYGYVNHYQSYGAYAYFFSNSPLDSGTITLRHSTGDTLLGMASVAVQDLPYGWSWWSDYGCRYGSFVSGISAEICSGWGYTQVWIYRNAGEVTYFDRYATTGDYYGWYWNYDYGYSSTNGSFIVFGPTYSADLQHEANGIVHGGSLDVPLYRYVYWDYDSGPQSWSNTWGYGTEDGHWQVSQHYEETYGFAQRSN